MVHGLRWTAEARWDGSGIAILQWSGRLLMGRLRQHTTQGCGLLVGQILKLEGNGWGAVEKCWGASGDLLCAPLDLEETTTQADIDCTGV